MNDSRRGFFFSFFFFKQNCNFADLYSQHFNKAVKLTYLCSHDIEFSVSRWHSFLFPGAIWCLLPAGRASVVKQPLPAGSCVTFTIRVSECFWLSNRSQRALVRNSLNKDRNELRMEKVVGTKMQHYIRKMPNIKAVLFASLTRAVCPERWSPDVHSETTINRVFKTH